MILFYQIIISCRKCTNNFTSQIFKICISIQIN